MKKIKKKTFKKFGFFIIIICIFYLGYISNHIIDLGFKYDYKKVPDSFYMIVYDCDDKNGVKSTSRCITSNVRSFYKFNPTCDFKNLSFSELKYFGGDCLEYSKLYSRLSKELDFYSNICIFNTSKSRKHAISIISDDDEYCVLDGKNYFCLDI